MMRWAKIIRPAPLIDKRVCGAEPSFGVRSLLTGRVQARTARWVTGLEGKVASDEPSTKRHILFTLFLISRPFPQFSPPILLTEKRNVIRKRIEKRQMSPNPYSIYYFYAHDLSFLFLASWVAIGRTFIFYEIESLPSCGGGGMLYGLPYRTFCYHRAYPQLQKDDLIVKFMAAIPGNWSLCPG